MSLANSASRLLNLITRCTQTLASSVNLGDLDTKQKSDLFTSSTQFIIWRAVPAPPTPQGRLTTLKRSEFSIVHVYGASVGTVAKNKVSHIASRMREVAQTKAGSTWLVSLRTVPCEKALPELEAPSALVAIAKEDVVAPIVSALSSAIRSAGEVLSLTTSLRDFLTSPESSSTTELAAVREAMSRTAKFFHDAFAKTVDGARKCSKLHTQLQHANLSSASAASDPAKILSDIATEFESLAAEGDFSISYSQQALLDLTKPFFNQPGATFIKTIFEGIPNAEKEIETTKAKLESSRKELEEQAQLIKKREEELEEHKRNLEQQRATEAVVHKELTEDITPEMRQLGLGKVFNDPEMLQHPIRQAEKRLGVVRSRLKQVHS